MKSERFFVAVCERVRAVAAERELTNLEVSQLCDVSYRTVHTIMHLKAKLTNRVIGKLAKGLNVSPAYLMTGEKTDAVITDHKPVWESKEPERVDETRGSVYNAVAVIAENFDVSEAEIMEWLGQKITQKRKKTQHT